MDYNNMMMALLYGKVNPNCFVCRKVLSGPDMAHPKTHPGSPFRTIPICNECNLKNKEQASLQGSKSDTNLYIKAPDFPETCAHCSKKYTLEYFDDAEFCSYRCRAAFNRPYKGSTLKKVKSRHSAGSCDCQDYYDMGNCTMVAMASPRPDFLEPLTPGSH